MKQKLKPILLITLFVILLAAAFVPTRSFAGTRLEPGDIKAREIWNGMSMSSPYLFYMWV